MKKTITTEEVLGIYQVLNTAKYAKLEDADKIKLFKIVRKLKPIAEAFEDESKDAAEKLKFEDFDTLLEKAKEYERKIRDTKEAEELPMGAAEYDAFIKKFKDYNKLVGEAVKKSAKKKNNLDFEPITEDAFNKLMSSNDWTFGQAVALELIIKN